MAVTIDELSYEDRAEMRRNLLTAQTEMEAMIADLEDALPVDANRQYSADEEIIKEILEDARGVLKTIQILLNKIELAPIEIREHLVMEGETLPIIAAKELGDANYWIIIAHLNGFIDPTDLTVGQRVLLPNVELEYEELVSD